MRDLKTQEQRLDYLLGKLRQEQTAYKDIPLPKTKKDKRDLMRSFVNVRMPEPIAESFLEIQDQFLQEEAREKGITKAWDLPAVAEEFHCQDPLTQRISLWKGDITTLAADAIINAANSQMLGCFVPCHGCIDNAIHTAAGIQLREACSRLMARQGHEEETGKAKITPGFNLPSKYVIHTVGPIITGTLTTEDCQLLASCYRSCLELAAEQGLKTIAFCCISTGEFRFPREKAAEIAVRTAMEFLKTDQHIKKVIFNVFKQEDYEIYQKIWTRRKKREITQSLP